MIYPLLIAIVAAVMPAHAALPEGIRHLRAIEEVADQGKCVEWTATAVEAGWPVEELPRLFGYMFRESRCLPEACSVPDRPDLRRCRDWGLMQINDYSWKSTVRRLGLEMEQLTDPYWNLWFSRWLYDYSVESTGCGWTPWYGKCSG